MSDFLVVALIVIAAFVLWLLRTRPSKPQLEEEAKPQLLTKEESMIDDPVGIPVGSSQEEAKKEHERAIDVTRLDSGWPLSMVQLAWVVTILGSILGAVVFVAGIVSANGAPQEAAVAGIALCLAVIPYVLARAISELKVG